MPFVNNKITSIRLKTYKFIAVMNDKAKDPYRFDGGGKQSG
jgi:hypothetical protein